MLKGRLSVVEAELEKTKELLEAGPKGTRRQQQSQRGDECRLGSISATTTPGASGESTDKQGGEEAAAPAPRTRGQEEGAKASKVDKPAIAPASASAVPKTPGNMSGADLRLSRLPKLV